MKTDALPSDDRSVALRRFFRRVGESGIRPSILADRSLVDTHPLKDARSVPNEWSLALSDCHRSVRREFPYNLYSFKSYSEAAKDASHCSLSTTGHRGLSVAEKRRLTTYLFGIQLRDAERMRSIYSRLS